MSRNKPRGQGSAEIPEESRYRLRVATSTDGKKLGACIHTSLGRAAGRPSRWRCSDGIARGETLIVERLDAAGERWALAGYVEWHECADNSVTIRDLGSADEAPDPGVCRVLVREMMRALSPASVHVKVRAEQQAWNRVFEVLLGFHLEGREYSRGGWWNVWAWPGRR